MSELLNNYNHNQIIQLAEYPRDTHLGRCIRAGGAEGGCLVKDHVRAVERKRAIHFIRGYVHKALDTARAATCVNQVLRPLHVGAAERGAEGDTIC